MTQLLREEQIINEIEILLKRKENCVIAIDGRCGSGKSTFAKMLSEKYGFFVVHMDDFFLPVELRNPERLSKIAGNIHTERFEQQVAQNIRLKQNFSYDKFDCKVLEFTEKIEIDVSKPIIIEGAYCLLEQFEDLYDMKIFMNIDKNSQKNRIVKRNGEKGYVNFENIWIPKEERYLKEKSIYEKCNFEYSTC